MRKKVFLSVALLILISLAVSVSAIKISKKITGYGTIEGDFVEIGYLNFEKGWNLISGLPSPDWLSGGDLDSKNIKAVYGFNPITQKYLRFYPNPDKNELGASNVRIDTMITTSAFWVYSDKRGRSEFMTLKPTSVNNKHLVSGWNIVGITPDMFDGDPFAGGTFSWNSIKGSCNFDQIYAWNPETQNWIRIPADLESSDFNDFMNMGVPVKVSKDCTLGAPGGKTMTPPPLPKAKCVDSDGGLKYETRGSVSKEGWETMADACVTDTKLSEAICNADGNPSGAQYNCPYGCGYGRCVKEGVCVLYETDKRTCSFEGVDYTVQNFGGCGVKPTKIRVSYQKKTEDLIVMQGDQTTLENGVIFKNTGAPCSIKILNVKFE